MLQPHYNQYIQLQSILVLLCNPFMYLYSCSKSVLERMNSETNVHNGNLPFKIKGPFEKKLYRRQPCAAKAPRRRDRSAAAAPRVASAGPVH